ncbi:hypothetical protein ACSSS7_000207 [Eimeria intestinalis]
METRETTFKRPTERGISPRRLFLSSLLLSCLFLSLLITAFSQTPTVAAAATGAAAPAAPGLEESHGSGRDVVAPFDGPRPLQEGDSVISLGRVSAEAGSDETVELEGSSTTEGAVDEAEASFIPADADLLKKLKPPRTSWRGVKTFLIGIALLVYLTKTGMLKKKKEGDQDPKDALAASTAAALAYAFLAVGTTELLYSFYVRHQRRREFRDLEQLLWSTPSNSPTRERIREALSYRWWRPHKPVTRLLVPLLMAICLAAVFSVPYFFYTGYPAEAASSIALVFLVSLGSLLPIFLQVVGYDFSKSLYKWHLKRREKKIEQKRQQSGQTETIAPPTAAGAAPPLKP